MALVDVDLVVLMVAHLAFTCLLLQLANSARSRWEDVRLQGDPRRSGTTEAADEHSGASGQEAAGRKSLREQSAATALEDYHAAFAVFFCANRWLIAMATLWLIVLGCDLVVALVEAWPWSFGLDDLWDIPTGWMKGYAHYSIYRLPWVVALLFLVKAVDRLFMNTYRGELEKKQEKPVHDLYWPRPRRSL